MPLDWLQGASYCQFGHLLQCQTANHYVCKYCEQWLTVRWPFDHHGSTYWNNSYSQQEWLVTRDLEILGGGQALPCGQDRRRTRQIGRLARWEIKRSMCFLIIYCVHCCLFAYFNPYLFYRQ